MCKGANISYQSLGAVGIAAPGPLKDDYALPRHARGKVFFDALQEQIGRRLNVPVAIDSLVNMAALSEGLRGSGQNTDSLVYVRVGHAMRSSILLNKKLLAGKNSLAGELGHIVMPEKTWKCHCGKLGCVNGIAAAEHFIEHCKEHGIELESMGQLPDLIANGKLHEPLKQVADAIAFAISAVINTIAPETVILSSPYAACGAAFQSPLIASLSKYTQQDLLLQCKIIYAQFNDSAEAFGAALSAMQLYPLQEQLQVRLEPAD
jgi:glucokinase